MTLDPAAPDALSLPTLRGSRTTLRAFAARDVAVVHEASTDPLIPLITTVPSEPDVDGTPRDMYMYARLLD